MTANNEWSWPQCLALFGPDQNALHPFFIWCVSFLHCNFRPWIWQQTTCVQRSFDNWLKPSGAGQHGKLQKANDCVAALCCTCRAHLICSIKLQAKDHQRLLTQHWLFWRDVYHFATMKTICKKARRRRAMTMTYYSLLVNMYGLLRVKRCFTTGSHQPNLSMCLLRTRAELQLCTYKMTGNDVFGTWSSDV